MTFKYKIVLFVFCSVCSPQLGVLKCFLLLRCLFIGTQILVDLYSIIITVYLSVEKTISSLILNFNANNTIFNSLLGIERCG
jgi:hypothetical protein